MKQVTTPKKPAHEFTDEERKALNERRCLDCGKFHPFIDPCPLVKSRTVEIKANPNPNNKTVIQITQVEYFPERAKLEVLASIDEVAEALDAE